jgi:hypothetical protein
MVESYNYFSFTCFLRLKKYNIFTFIVQNTCYLIYSQIYLRLELCKLEIYIVIR